MISSKVIKVVKENSFNQGWTLFDQWEFPVNKNHIFQDYPYSSLVELINNASVINLVLSDASLSEDLLSLLKIVSERVLINVVARNEEIVSSYSSLKLNSIRINASVAFNYICVIGEDTKSLMISDKYIETNNLINEIYFENKTIREDYAFLSQVARMIIIDKKGEKDYQTLIERAHLENINCIYVVDPKYFTKDIFYFALSNNLDLVVASVLKEGVILQNKNATLSCLKELDGGKHITYPLESMSEYVEETYKCLFLDDVINIDNLLDKVYCVSNGVVEKFNLVDTKVVFHDIKLSSISDFISEKFDDSISKDHNNYSNKAYKVEYQFNLIPPTFDASYSVSNIYNELHELKREWDELQTLKIEDIKQDYIEVLREDVGLIEFIDNSVAFNETLTTRINDSKYEGYYKLVNNAKALFENYKRSLLVRCKDMYNAVSKENLNSKFDKFDIEIEGYKNAIHDKRVLISEGIEVNSNRRSVEILEKKVADLLRLKASFEGKTSSINDDKGLEVFLDKCNDTINNNKQIQSISDIVKTKEITKMAKLKTFIDNHLYSLNAYIIDCLTVIDKLRDIHIPENYIVYEKNDERYIVIDDLYEFYDTKDLREEFNLKCIVRR